MKGSSRAPNRLRVRRTPLATARTLPCSRVSMVTIRSASPSWWVRRTTASSRYRLTGRLSYAAPTAAPPPRAGAVKSRLVDGDAVAAGLLGRVQRRVGVLEHAVG